MVGEDRRNKKEKTKITSIPKINKTKLKQND